MAKTAALQDTFATQDATKWTYNAAAVATGGQVQLPVASSFANQIYSSSGWDLTGSVILAQLVQRPNVGSGGTICLMSFDVSAGNQVMIQLEGANLIFRERVASVDSDTTLTFNGTTHAWWRIRESGGVIYWDTAPDGYTWTNRRSKTAALTLTSGLMLLQSGYSGVESSPGTAIFDNFNVPPMPAGSVSWTVCGCQGGEMTFMSSLNRAAVLDVANDCGIEAIRIDVDWTGIEPTEGGGYNWTNVDTAVSEIKAAGIEVCAVLDYGPAWAVVGGATHALVAPAHMDDWAAFCSAAVTRYASDIQVWEMRNEPNGAPSATVANYTTMMLWAYPAIKAAQPTSVVLQGGTMPAGGAGLPATWLSGIYSNGGKYYFDHANHHPYSYPVLPSYVAPWNSFQQMWDIRAVLVANGDSAKKIWMTEFGAPTGTASGLAVNYATQAQMFTEAFAYQSANSWMGPLFIYDIWDKGTNLADVEDNFGLVENDYDPKTSFGVVQALAPTPPPVDPTANTAFFADF